MCTEYCLPPSSYTKIVTPKVMVFGEGTLGKQSCMEGCQDVANDFTHTHIYLNIYAYIHIFAYASIFYIYILHICGA